LNAIATLAAAGIPAGVMIAPVIPGLNEHEIPSILKAAAEAGARSAGYILVRLPLGVAPLFEDWLGHHFPDRKDKVLERIRSMRSGRLNDARFGVRMTGEGNAAIMIAQIFKSACRRAGLNRQPWPVTAAAFRRPGQRDRQLDLFE
jgi:DNA repair photolyase